MINEFSINSKILGTKITFYRPSSYYIYTDYGKPNTMKQIVKKGSCLGYSGSNQKEFEKVCRLWYRSHIKQVKEIGY